MKDATAWSSFISCSWPVVPQILLGAGLFFGSIVSANAQIPLATGSGVTVLPEPNGPFFDITAYGAVSNGPAVQNQTAINAAIAAAAAGGGGTVLIPAGTFKSYSIHLQSNVGLHFESINSVLRAAIQGTGPGQDGGFYDAPEANIYVGLQDQGHSHWQDSLIWGIGLHNVMISGPGLIDGSYIDASGSTVPVLAVTDVPEVATRTASGTAGQANKAIALKNCTDVVFRDFAIKNGGHFGILGTSVNNWTIDGIIVDTDRDAFDIDCSQNVTVRNSVFNSTNDDALVLKATFALGTFTPTKNVLLEHDIVSGYEPGSVLSGAYAQGQLNPMTGRVKLGTEASSGFDTVTIRNITFEHCAGFALESVDGAVLTNIVFTDSTMNDIYTPIFIRLGDRGRTPVTGISSSQTVSPSGNVRLDNSQYVLPNLPAQYGYFAPSRYAPSYAQNLLVPIGGEVYTGYMVSQTAPTALNPSQVCYGCATNPVDGNAIGPGAQGDGSFAVVSNISISNLTVTDADPRYPIILAGLEGHPIRNVSLSNVTVQYRGGLTVEQVVENRYLHSSWNFYAYGDNGSAMTPATIDWLGRSANEGYLPRIGWNPAANGGAGGWAQDPYNIPELPFLYPENVMFGPLPAYGIWARHVTGLSVNNVSLSFLAPDDRPAVVLDDVSDAVFQGFTAAVGSGVPVFVEVTNTKKRPADLEYILNWPYSTDTVTNVTVPPGLAVQQVTVDRPAPGTPPDTLYRYPTVPSASHPYSYSVATASYPLPVTVLRPFFDTAAPRRSYSATVGQQVQFTVQAYSPASGSETAAAQTGLTYSTGALPSGAAFGSQVFTWTPNAVGVYQVQFMVSDGVMPESKTVTIRVGYPTLPVANPGPSRTVRLGSLVTLDGSGSQDPASATPELPAWWTLSFSWVQTAGPAVTLGSGGSTAMSPTFVATVAGTYAFQLVVSDGAAASAPASITLTVSGPRGVHPRPR
jgi:hypothetical protein